MDTTPYLGFWRQWDVELLNFQFVTWASILGTLFLAAFSKLFDFTKLIDVGSWEVGDVYLFLGPVLASIASLVIADASTWLVYYDFGVENEMVIYWGSIILTVLVQITGNGVTALIVGVFALLAFAFFGAFAVLPILALSGPLALSAAAVVLFLIGLPLLYLGLGAFLMAYFIGLTIFLLLDSILKQLTQPAISLELSDDPTQQSWTATVVNDLVDTLEGSLVDLLGPRALRGIADDFELHLGLHLTVVAPLALLLTLGKLYLGIKLYENNFASQFSGFLDSLREVWSKNELFYYPAFGLIMTVLNLDGILITMITIFFLILILRSQDIDYQLLIPLGFADGLFDIFLHSFFEVGTMYWAIYAVVRSIEKWISSTEHPPQQQQPEVGLSIGDIASALTYDGIEDFPEFLLDFTVKPLIIMVILPGLQILTWALQTPFYFALKDHIMTIKGPSV